MLYRIQVFRLIFLFCLTYLFLSIIASTVSLAHVNTAQKGDINRASDVVTSEWWLAQAQKELEAREYFVMDNGQGLEAPNRKHNFRSYFSHQGLKVKERKSTESKPILSMQYAGWTRDLGKNTATQLEFESNNKTVIKPRIAKDIRAEENQVRLTHTDGFVEWYINRSDGLEHGFDVAKRPEGLGLLSVFVDVGYARLEQQGDDIVARIGDQRQLDYQKLLVVDAKQNRIPATMRLISDNRIQIQVDDRQAVYPIIIDPLITGSVDTLIEGDQPSSQFGISVASAGDVNGDAYDDVIVGAPRYDLGVFEEGAAFVFYGSADGLSLTGSTRLNGDQSASSFGISVASAGDVNGDTYDDVIVGAPFYDNGEENEGAAFIFHGGPSGIGTNFITQVESNQTRTDFGLSVAGAGDVNGDNYDDVVIGARFYDFIDDPSRMEKEGAVFVYYGGPNGISSENSTTLRSNQREPQFGVSVASAGNVNGDEYDDVIVGAVDYGMDATKRGAALVYLGSQAGLNTTVSTLLYGDNTRSGFGFSVSGAGDVNNDTFDDVIVGAFIGGGAAFVYQGGEDGVNPSASTSIRLNDIESGMEAVFGSSVSGAGDVNGDDYDDVIVGAALYENGESREGAALIYLGSDTGVRPTTNTIIEGNVEHARFGFSVSGAGDVDGDGFSDVIVGVSYDGTPQLLTQAGEASVFLGSDEFTIPPLPEDPIIPEQDEPAVPENEEPAVPENDEPVVPDNPEPNLPENDNPVVPENEESVTAQNEEPRELESLGTDGGNEEDIDLNEMLDLADQEIPEALRLDGDSVSVGAGSFSKLTFLLFVIISIMRSQLLERMVSSFSLSSSFMSCLAFSMTRIFANSASRAETLKFH